MARRGKQQVHIDSQTLCLKPGGDGGKIQILDLNYEDGEGQSKIATMNEDKAQILLDIFFPPPPASSSVPQDCVYPDLVDMTHELNTE